jgi:YfiH family protein
LEIELFPFRLEFAGEPLAARFPFIFNGKPVRELPGGPAPSCAVSARSAGNMRFDPQGGGFHGPVRERLFRSLGINPERVYSLRQVHSRDVYAIGGAAGENPPPGVFAREGDGIVSFCREAVPAVTVADCLPVFLLDTVNGYFAALHSGWKGTGIVLKALALMKAAGSDPAAIAAVLGPCIQGCCYRVDEARAAAFETEFGEASAFAPSGTPYPLGPVRLRREGGVFLSLQGANARLLAASGVRNIAYCEDCTYTDERLGSFRREGAQDYTHMVALAGRFPEAKTVH